jgi:hypothetical protein
MSLETMQSSRVCMKVFVTILIDVCAERSDVLVLFLTILTEAIPCPQDCHPGEATRSFRNLVDSFCKWSQDDIAAVLRA